MSRDPVVALAARLLAAVEEVARALENDDPEPLLVANQARESAFAALRARVGDSPPPQIHELLRKVRAVDAQIFARTPVLRDEIRQERELLGVARDAARAVRQQDGPRFLDLRA